MSIYDVSKKCKLDVHVYLEELSAKSMSQGQCHKSILHAK